MSTRSGLVRSSGQKREISDEKTSSIDAPPSKIMKGETENGSEILQVSYSLISGQSDESTQTESNETHGTEEPLNESKVRYSIIVKRAINARRRLDASIRRSHHSAVIKKSLALLKSAMDSHFWALTSKLELCQKSNKKLKKEVANLKLAVEHKKPLGRTSHGDKPVKQAKGRRLPSVVVSVPDEMVVDDQLTDLETEQTVCTENEKPQNIQIEDNTYFEETKPQNASDTNFYFITLNTEEDYPDGSWLGDPSNPSKRVRCKVSPTEMMHTMNNYKSAEKLALKLLDLLFDKETQAASNLSGTGKHKKKKLDPLLVYGIHCHLVNHFGISNEDWYRIRQNIDSKCRTAFRRKQKGLDLNPRWNKKNKISTSFATEKNQTVEHLQEVVHQLQAIPAGGLTGITIIQPEQLKEVIAQAGQGSEIHLSSGETIALSQSGELEIRGIQHKGAKK